MLPKHPLSNVSGYPDSAAGYLQAFGTMATQLRWAPFATDPYLVNALSRVADGQQALVEVDIVVIKADRFADPHAAPKHGLRPRPPALPRTRPHPTGEGNRADGQR